MSNQERRARIHRVATAPPAIGPAGVAARVLTGAVLIGMALFWREPSWADAALGLAALPAVVMALLAFRARRSPAPLRLTGAFGHGFNAAVFVPLLLLPPTAGAALLFYGASMLVAATRRSGGCEITAISNTLLARDDVVGCMLFAPVDIAESRLRQTPATSGPPRR